MAPTPIVVLAVGGNSLIGPDKSDREVPKQFKTADETAKQIAQQVLADGAYRLVVTHGNGPHVGFLLLQSTAGSKVAPETPLDVCVAMTQGSIGYIMTQCLQNQVSQLPGDLASTPVATVMTQVVVDSDDPAFQQPSKPVGPFYTADEARAIKDAAAAQSDGPQVTLREDAGRGWRRVVASPEPVRIVERATIQTLLDAGTVVVCGGGGGVPVVESSRGSGGCGVRRKGVAAVIDKDAMSALLAANLGAEILVISTAVPCAYKNWGKADQAALTSITSTEAATLCDEGHFAAGSMLPKIRSAIGFVTARHAAGNSQARAVICDPSNMKDAMAGTAGTTVVYG
eukprot:TRINITY_DN33446_c0_g1_i1.p1 TRINITY_DN33446_c0_g1~~TRINITY_DN33446_c0_g1_i1.p1  ORF type:complete len:342 (-),score=65.56 TRINITY_DN33446_c0_g1_i1:120-1145(-)